MNPFKMHRYFVSVFNIIVLLFMACACNYSSTDAINDGLDEVILLLKKESYDKSDKLILIAENLKISQTKILNSFKLTTGLEGKFDNNDSEKAIQWVRRNQSAILEIINKINNGIEESMAEVNKLSKDAYLENDPSMALWKYIFSYFKLQYFRNNVRKSIEILSPIAFIIHSSALENDHETLDFRMLLEKNLLTMMGVGVVIDQDYNEIKEIITQYSKNGTMSDELKKTLALADLRVKQEMNKYAEKFSTKSNECSNETNSEQCIKLKKIKKQIGEEYQKISFLYTPGKKYFLITKMLTVIGNLSWGLVNSLIGVGIILTAMIVSPFSSNVDFPSFHIAYNNMQIYVDVSNMSPLAGKLSMGIFEFDNHAGYEQYSLHEGGHAIQSAVLGPLYLPIVLLTYAVSGFDQGLMENLANDSARASDVWL